MAKREGDLAGRCPYVSKAQAVIGGRWKIEILYYIGLKDVTRFGGLKRCTGGISESTLSKQLRELETDGLIERNDFHEVPPRVEYALTARGKGFIPVLEAIRDWGEREFRDGTEGEDDMRG